MLFWVVWVDTTEWCRNMNIKKLSFQRQKSAIGIPRTLLEFAGQRWNSPDNFFAPFCCPANANNVRGIPMALFCR